MRIAHLAATMTAAGGLQSHVAALLAEQHARGDDVAVLHVDEGADVSRGVETIRAGPGRAMLDRLAERSPDVVHVHGTPLSAAVERELQERFPVVRSLHDFSFGCSTGQHWFRDGTPCTRAHGPGCLAAIATKGCAHRLDLRPALLSYRGLGRRLQVIRSASAVVVYSEYTRGVALANDIVRERCHAIPYFVHAPQGTPEPAAGRDVAFVGRIVGAKGLDVLIEALARRPEAWETLLVAGDGWDRARCEQLAARRGLAERVRFLGWLGPEGVGDVLRRAAVLAIPSRWPEPFGIVGLEALAAGRPVVASRVGGIPEWLDDTIGRLVSAGDAAALADALAETLADPEGCARQGEAGRRRAARFSPQAHLAALDAVYRTVI